MKYVAREYQSKAVDAVLEYLSNGGKSGLLCFPTGTGKAGLPALILNKYFSEKPFSKAMMITHRKALIVQNHNTLKRVWPDAPCGIYSAGLKRKDQHDAITYGGIQSLYKKAELFGKIDIVIIDEAHLISANSESCYGKFLADLRVVNPDLAVIGMTATPYRLDSGMLVDGGIFTDIIIDMTQGEDFVWFIDQGYLADLHSKDVAGRFDTSNIKHTGGDFNIAALSDRFNRTEVSQKIAKEVLARRGTRKHGVCFAISIEHAEELSRMFNEIGISSTVAHSKLSDAEVDANIKDYMSGRYEMLVDVERYTTGFDYPNIDYIVMARPTESASLWVQMNGRGTRPVYVDGYDLDMREGRLASIAAGPKPNGCLVLDFAGNGLRLGPINAPITSKNKAEKTLDGLILAPQKICPECFSYVHAAKTFCNSVSDDGLVCHYEFPKGQEVAMSGEIVEGLLIRRDTHREDRLYDVSSYKIIHGKTFKGKDFISITIRCRGLPDPISSTLYMSDQAYDYAKANWKILLPNIPYPYLRGGNSDNNIRVCKETLDDNFKCEKVIVWINNRDGDIIKPKLIQVG